MSRPPRGELPGLLRASKWFRHVAAATWEESVDQLEWVELEAGVDRKTSRGQTLVALHHQLKNQRDELVVSFTEKIIFDPAR